MLVWSSASFFSNCTRRQRNDTRDLKSKHLLFSPLSVNTTSVNKCPDTKKSSTCHVGLKNTCNNDAECANGTYCCFTGCRRQCWDPKTRSSSTLSKDWFVLCVINER